MIVWIAFAKTMTDKAVKGAPCSTQARFEKEAMETVSWMSRFSSQTMMELLRVNEKIASETVERYQLMERGEAELLPALLSYSGAVFKRISARDFNRIEWAFAQKHLRIFSALYGMLRPLDRVGAYRMEGWVQLPDNEGKLQTRFEKWKKLLTQGFIQEIIENGGVLLHLASEEMQLFVDWEEVCRRVRVVKPDFYEIRDGKLRSVTMYAKMCRGEMVRYIIHNQIDDIESVKGFQWEGFQYSPNDSSPDHLVFVRMQAS